MHYKWITTLDRQKHYEILNTEYENYKYKGQLKIGVFTL